MHRLLLLLLALLLCFSAAPTRNDTNVRTTARLHGQRYAVVQTSAGSRLQRQDAGAWETVFEWPAPLRMLVADSGSLVLAGERSLVRWIPNRAPLVLSDEVGPIDELRIERGTILVTCEERVYEWVGFELRERGEPPSSLTIAVADGGFAIEGRVPFPTKEVRLVRIADGSWRKLRFAHIGRRILAFDPMEELGEATTADYTLLGRGSKTEPWIELARAELDVAAARVVALEGADRVEDAVDPQL